MVDTQRDIAAVMFTDMRGFTALMQSDEELTLQLLDLQRRLADPLLEKYRGRLIKTIGDAFMVEFRSAIDAVRCAIGLQQALHDHNVAVPAERQLHIRIGVHMGDVMRSGDDLLGDTVNIAARVEPLADADGIAMTQAVYEQVRNRLEQTIEAQGIAQFKGVTGDTPLYRVLLPWSVPGNAPRRSMDATRKRNRLIAGAATAAVAVAGIIAWATWYDRTSPAAIVAAPAATTAVPVAAPVRDGKSIAVLPFANLGGRPEDAYLADGLHEEVLNALARLHALKVISRTSVMEYRGKTDNVREIGERLGVGMILEGSIRRDGNKLRLTVQLIDARDDRHLLASNYDRDLTHVFDLQSTVARLVANALAATLSRNERGELDRVATNSGDAYDRYLRAIAAFRKPVPGDEDGLIAPKRLLEEALQIDPDYADAFALLSQVHTWTFFVNAKPEDGTAARKAFERANELQPDLAEARLARGLYTLYVAKDPERAVNDLKSVVEARPNSAEAYVALGFALRRRGQFEQALAAQLRALDLDPLNEVYSTPPITTLLGLRRFPEALAQAQAYVDRFPSNPEPYLIRAHIESQLQQSAAPIRSALREQGHLLPPMVHKVVEAEIARREGRYLDAVKLWDAVPPQDPLARGERIGFLYFAAGDKVRAERIFRDAERYALERLRKSANIDLRQLAIVQSMLGKHTEALATIELARLRSPEARDPVNGPYVSFARSVILVRAGRREEGHAEAVRLLRVPFGAPLQYFEEPDPILLLLKGDPHYEELIERPPRL